MNSGRIFSFNISTVFVIFRKCGIVAEKKSTVKANAHLADCGLCSGEVLFLSNVCFNCFLIKISKGIYNNVGFPERETGVATGVNELRHHKFSAGSTGRKDFPGLLLELCVLRNLLLYFRSKG